jgi:hypothetical protein
MKPAQSLIALLQFVGVCQIVFGLLIVQLPYDDAASDILPQIRDKQVRSTVTLWHLRTVNMARWWCICSGAASLCLATALIAALRHAGQNTPKASL